MREYMKITVIMGSPRKKDSYQVCRMIEEQMKKQQEMEFEYIYLTDFHIEACKGCNQCFQRGEQFCPCRDEVQEIKEKLMEADGLIFASPVYACQITGVMKCLIDRLSYLFHRQELVGKPALTVVTTGGGGQKATGNYLKMTAGGWGCSIKGEIKIISPMFFKQTQKQAGIKYRESYYKSRLSAINQAADRLCQAAAEKKKPVPAFYDLFMFQCLRSKTMVSQADYDYWKEKGWLNAPYFYETTLNPAKKAFVFIVRACINCIGKRMLAS